MKPPERDILLARLDERTSNIWYVLDEKDESVNKKIDKILSHQIEQNGAILKNTINIKWIRIVGGGLFTIAVGVILKLLGVY